ncbi:hypothetical protein IMZ31_20205 (plasmid) [Pontibacillus sp. ALD_SL1]|uniref:hypothetical protein n=1 Tax=Pontibacillus sp. ALD_SL1 TaxID=2777185 RepID=UPI001A969CBD|nr:hypothetical protein [Pontibacillus sp. ALD_SL1]QST02875.1 hypothetical protein IMZ31_20205 [Pontibacillus sp. ALD_SL1]
MERDDIMKLLADRLNDNRYMLLGLAKYEHNFDRSPSKMQLMDYANKLYEKAVEQGIETPENPEQPLIGSRHVLDVYAAKLEGAGLVNVEEIGRVRVFRLSKFGRELLQYIQEKELHNQT